jgi:predicted esterase
VRHSLDDLSDLCAWELFPTGTTPWSGDDWHIWGLADVEAAVAAIPKWIERTDWDGAGVDIDKWFVAGHSNGGQGAWYILTHRPDKVIAAAVVSGYSSIPNYVPYTFWHTMEPAKEGLIQSALLPYRHELLLENAKDIPVVQQHGSADDNVPVYNARLMSQRIHQAGAYSEYFEMLDRPHFWKGVMATKPLSHFFNEHLERHREEKATNVPLHLRNFTVVVADPGDMGSKNGLVVLNLQNQGRLGKVSMLYDPLTTACAFRTINVWNFLLPRGYYDCSRVTIDGTPVTLSAQSEHGNVLHKSDNGWTVVQSHRPHIRTGRQRGNMDAMLRTLGTFSIVTHSPGVESIALEISRNLCQYYNADTDITSNYTLALSRPGNIISVAVGADLPQLSWKFAIQADDQGLGIYYYVYGQETFYSSTKFGLAATFLRPLPDGRLELVVWAAEQSGLSTAARLVPMLTGSGQPDFVVADREMLRKGVEGTLALGFFDSFWDVVHESYLAQ